jgi:transketolase
MLAEPTIATRVCVSALIEFARTRPDLVCLVADLGRSAEVDGFRAEFPERFFNLGMPEQNMMGIAGGLARAGEMPFVNIFGVFATRRPYDQISMSIAYPKLNVKIVGFLPGLTIPGGVTHQAIDDLALMRTMPNMTVLDPADAVELRQAIQVAAEQPGPVYLRALRGNVPVLFDEATHRLTIGQATWLRHGGDATIVTAGIKVAEAVSAANELAADGIKAGILHSPSIKPLDATTIVAAARATGTIVTAENHTIIGGLGSAVAEALAEGGVAARFARIGLRDCYAEGGSQAFLFDRYGLSARHIAQTVRGLLRGGAGASDVGAAIEAERSGQRGV